MNTAKNLEEDDFRCRLSFPGGPARDCGRHLEAYDVLALEPSRLDADESGREPGREAGREAGRERDTGFKAEKLGRVNCCCVRRDIEAVARREAPEAVDKADSRRTGAARVFAKRREDAADTGLLCEDDDADDADDEEDDDEKANPAAN